MNLKELKEIIAIFEGSGLSELELDREGMRLRLRKGEVAGEKKEGKLPPEPETRPVPEAREGPGRQIGEVICPMVGTFYSAPAPDTEPFAEEGKRVEAGDVVCIIEAMKLMNEVKSEVTGIVREVLVENGHAVEFGEVLFRIEAE